MNFVVTRAILDIGFITRIQVEDAKFKDFDFHLKKTNQKQK